MTNWPAVLRVASYFGCVAWLLWTTWLYSRGIMRTPRQRIAALIPFVLCLTAMAVSLYVLN